MPRLALLLLTTCVAFGCGSPRAVPTTPAEVQQPATGGVVRWLVGSEGEARRAVVTHTALPLVGFGPFAGVAAGGSGFPEAGSDGCHRFFPDPDLASRGAGARGIVRSWREGIAAAGESAGWLFEPLGGATRIRARDEQVVICPSRPAPDLAMRLRHPAAWIRFPGRQAGPGPFRESGTGDLVPGPGSRKEGPFVDRVELVPAGETRSSLWVGLGEVDLAVVYGDSAAELREKEAPDWTLRRTPQLDRVYYLALDREKRWTMDPSFRRWLSWVIDRPGLLRYALGGEGEIVSTLSSVEDPPPLTEPSRRAFGPGSRPRLALGYDETDPVAIAIAERIQSTVELHEVALRLVPAAADGVQPEVMLRRSLPPTRDPVLGLWHEVVAAGVGGAPVERMLEQASRLASTAQRRDAAWLAEDALLLEAEVVPLVRAHGWLAVRRGLRQVEVAPGGLVSLRGAWWEP